MKRLLIIGFTGCAFALAPTLSASAMPAATPYALGGADGAAIQVHGGHGHWWGYHGGRGHPRLVPRPPLWLVSRQPIRLATSSPLVVTFISSQQKREAAFVGSLSL